MDGSLEELWGYEERVRRVNLVHSLKELLLYGS